MGSQEIADALDAFEQAVMAIGTIRATVRRGRPTEEDVRLHAARTATQFYFSTVCKRTARVGLPGDTPDQPAKVRSNYRKQNNHEK